MKEYIVMYQFTIDGRLFENKFMVMARDSIEATRKFRELFSAPNIQVISID